MRNAGAGKTGPSVHRRQMQAQRRSPPRETREEGRGLVHDWGTHEQGKDSQLKDFLLCLSFLLSLKLYSYLLTIKGVQVHCRKLGK